MVQTERGGHWNQHGIGLNGRGGSGRECGGGGSPSDMALGVNEG